MSLTLTVIGNSNYKSNEACKIIYACLIYASFLHSTADKSLFEPTSYYETEAYVNMVH